MKAGHDYEKAKRQAQANADYSGESRWLWLDYSTWRIDRAPVEGAEEIKPRKTGGR